jgi:hypothetical protein
MRDDELAAVVAALNLYFQQQAVTAPEAVSKWKLTARRESVEHVR